MQGIPLLLKLLSSIKTPQPQESSCSFLGPDFLAPSNLAESSFIDTAKTKFTESLKSGKFGQVTTNDTAFSVNFFSADEGVLFEHHNKPTGVPISIKGAVDGDSIYRIGSLSKLWTVYAFLALAGEEHLSQPVTKYVTELDKKAKSEGKGEVDEIDSLQWNDVTLGQIASQMSGVVRDVTFGDISAIPDLGLEEKGFPKLNSSQIPTCGALQTQKACSRKEFFGHLLTESPAFPVGQTPTYSNIAFQVLGYALEEIMGKPIKKIMDEDFFAKLNMDGSSYALPLDQSKAVVLGGKKGEVATFWSTDIGDETPGGGFYSTTNDMALSGQSILKHKLLTAAETRRWMKPVTHTGDIRYSIGMPWEIVRTSSANGRTTDLYTKSGDLGSYSSYLVLSPDHNVGFSVIATNPSSGKTHEAAAILANAIISTMLPAVEDTAKEEAGKNLGGDYVFAKAKAKLTLATDDRPGLNVSFVAGGLPFFQALAQATGQMIDPAAEISLRLFPTGLTTQTKKKDGKDMYASRMAFRMTQDVLPREAQVGDFSGFCFNWFIVGQKFYGGKALDEFIFGFKEDGSVEYAEYRALGLKMAKQ